MLRIVNNAERCRNSTTVWTVVSFYIHVGKDAQLPVLPFFRCNWCRIHLKISQKKHFFFISWQFFLFSYQIQEKNNFFYNCHPNVDQILGKQHLRGAPYKKFHNQNHHFSPNLGLDSIANPGN